ncbi:hypothetical protein BCR35DRAFT_248672, partial [Leucosporidium creatinivorum]
YTLAFQCVVNIGVRGSETIRTRVVDAGALDVVVNVLERYLEESARRKRGAEKELLEGSRKTVASIVAPPPTAIVDQAEGDNGRPQVEDKPNEEGLQYRDEDVLLSLQLLAYLSKYPHVRSPPSTPTLSSNVFSLVEAFTHRPPTSDPHAPRHSNEVQYWAGVIMRNACRKDESRGGIRQCANMQCGVWEKYAREFAKCRRCRKAKYCSKGCQSSAWGRGHRYWCAK